MHHRTRHVLRFLLATALLAFGPLHAKAMYACDMDEAVHAACCCGDDGFCVDADCAGDAADRCCERVLLTATTVETHPGLASAPSGLDPPPAAVACSGPGIRRHRAHELWSRRADTPVTPVPAWLSTQRLLI